MDDDLTASHWDDVPSSSHGTLANSQINSIFETLDLDNPHQESLDEQSEPEDNGGESAGEEIVHSANFDSGDGAFNHQPPESSLGFFAESNTGFDQTQYNQSEWDELSAMKQQERDIHMANLLSKLTNDGEDSGFGEVSSPAKISSSDFLFDDKDSPIKLSSSPPAVSSPRDRSVSNEAFLSPTRFKNGKFKATRGRKYPVKVTRQHLREDMDEPLDPLSSPSKSEASDGSQRKTAHSKTDSIVSELSAPLYTITSKEGTKEGIEALPPKSLYSKNQENNVADGNELDIALSDPVKIGDITTAHIVYEVKTRNKNLTSKYFPENTQEVVVSRRYRDFRWIYHQLQNNHPGKIIPPPPSKKTYIGRFNENFVENRRFLLEKSINKIAGIPSLANDPDFVMFLTSQNFANDSKEREQASGSGASVQASRVDEDGDKNSSSSTVVSGTGSTGGFMSSLFSLSVKLPEPDEFFTKKKGYFDDLEHNLRTFYKSMELIANQRIDIVSVVEEIASIMEELSDLEISKTTSNLLSAFAEVQLKLKENLDRVNLQDQMTLGFTIEEYLRIIGSVKYTFETRSKIYQQYQSFKQELLKKEDALDRLNSKYKSSVDKINQVTFEVDKLKQKVSYYENSFKTISDTIRSEMETFEIEKIKDFRNSVEIFIESSIESQKEAIELWETFYERQKLASV